MGPIVDESWDKHVKAQQVENLLGPHSSLPEGCSDGDAKVTIARAK